MLVKRQNLLWNLSDESTPKKSCVKINFVCFYDLKQIEYIQEILLGYFDNKFYMDCRSIVQVNWIPEIIFIVSQQFQIPMEGSRYKDIP